MQDLYNEATNSATTSTTEVLEALIDKHGLVHVLIGLQLVCAEKAEYIRSLGWKIAARNWDAASRICFNAARKVKV